MKTFHCDVLTPDGAFFGGEVAAVQVPGVSGSFEALYNHAPLITTLVKGQVRVTKADGQQQFFSVDGGVVEVQNNKMVVLAEKIIE